MDKHLDFFKKQMKDSEEMMKKTTYHHSQDHSQADYNYYSGRFSAFKLIVELCEENN